MEQRAKKFGVVPNNPLDFIVGMAGSDAFWENRRDAAADEVERAEAVYVFGTDRLSTQDLLRLFCVSDELERPTHVEWINDSSANVCFGSSEAAEAALVASSEPLLPGEVGAGPATWRTLPLARAAEGKGLQLLLRRATTRDIKPARRAESRWYGEAARGGGGKRSRIHDKRGERQRAAAPYARREQGPTLAERVAAAHAAAAATGPTLSEHIERAKMPSLASKLEQKAPLPDLATALTSERGIPPDLASALASARK